MGEISDERARIARELHDGIAQDLAAIGYALDSEIGRSDVSDSARKSLRSIRHQITELNAELRREIFELRTKHALTPQQELKEVLDGLKVHFTIEGELSNSAVGTELFKVIQEFARNACAHGKASKIGVLITPNRIAIDNDGSTTSTSNSLGFGLTGIEERLLGIGWRIRPGSTFDRVELIAAP